MRKPKKMWAKPSGNPNSDINVTPLVDVVLVMLIIFMVVTPLLEKDIEVRVPTTEQVEQQKEVPKDQLVVRLTSEGDLKINTETVTQDKYVERLRQILAPRSAADKVVFIVADDKTNYGRLVAALDGAKQAGAETLGMMTQLPEDIAQPPKPAP
jgi:biopolymer transport protein TolR